MLYSSVKVPFFPQEWDSSAIYSGAIFPGVISSKNRHWCELFLEKHTKYLIIMHELESYMSSQINKNMKA